MFMLIVMGNMIMFNAVAKLFTLKVMGTLFILIALLN